MTPLHAFGDSVRELFLLIPLGAVRALFVAVPVVLVIWVLCLPREVTTPTEDAGPGKSATRWDANLKLWASVALLLQIVIYTLV